ncbi:MAG: hypothetical protein DMG96_01080 [Acidobacteria bacterium]|nr:MAG: hypothetical protein DMG96_01080 [Acidobacteriota bacterium]
MSRLRYNCSRFSFAAISYFGSRFGLGLEHSPEQIIELLFFNFHNHHFTRMSISLACVSSVGANKLGPI